MSPFAWIGIGGVCLVAIAWLVVSFQKPSRSRSLLEWLGATGLYLALLGLFLNLSLRAWEGDSRLALGAFGFLATLFSIGLILSLVKTVGALRGRSGSQTSATN